MKKILLLLRWYLASISICATSVYCADITENQLKAAYIVSFAGYIEWPVGAFRDANTPFIIGIWGDNELMRTLSNGVASRQIQGRTVKIIEINKVEQAKQTQILYIKTPSNEIMQQLIEAPTITISENDRIITFGGFIRFYMVDQKLRFEINHKGAERVGFKISAKLLQLAKNMRGETSQ